MIFKDVAFYFILNEKESEERIYILFINRTFIVQIYAHKSITL